MFLDSIFNFQKEPCISETVDVLFSGGLRWKSKGEFRIESMTDFNMLQGKPIFGTAELATTPRLITSTMTPT